MMILENTIGGVYEYDNYGKTVAYTFPENACVNLNSIKISIAGLRVECYGGLFDEKSILHFLDAVSKIPSKSNKTFNANIFINDNKVCGQGYPCRDDFITYDISYGYVNPKEFMELQDSIETNKIENPSLFKKHQDLILFFQKWSKNNGEKTKKQIDSIVNNLETFPKKISLLYDDRKLKHTSHIILQYTNKNECTLHIDNTLSLVGFLGEKVVQQLCTGQKIMSDPRVAVSSSRSQLLAQIKPPYSALH